MEELEHMTMLFLGQNVVDVIGSGGVEARLAVSSASCNNPNQWENEGGASESDRLKFRGHRL